ncbi:MAG: hypothetical protein BIFFINMI_02019 [Phycisphaerae bacterium]|nr:hypothetical protein [Phycisphaerae bacterium]
MAEVNAFADEYGQPNLDTAAQDVSTHYIVTAIIVEDRKSSPLQESLELVRATHFQTGPMKSSSIGDNDDRRIRVLSDFRAKGLIAIALVVDKELISKESGLRFQRPFRRFLNRKLYDELYDTFPSLRLIADRVGKTDFMIQFQRFLEEHHHLNTLFDDSVMEWGHARNNVILQAADVVAGSLGRCFDRKKLSPRADELRRTMIPWVQLRDWPWRAPTAAADMLGVEDTAVRGLSFRRAEAFVERNHASDDEDVRHQVQCLKYLVFYAAHIDSEAYVHAPEIIASIQVPRAMTLRQFQTRVIAGLRDADVLIASDSRGYKLPSGMNDVVNYLRWTNKQVEPMVTRARRMAQAIELASNGQVRLLDAEEFAFLRGPSPYPE